jgi:hypothetical protein
MKWNDWSLVFCVYWVLLLVKVKVKLSLCFNWAPCHKGIFGEWRYSSMHSLISALDVGEWSASRTSRFTPRERAPSTHWIGGWVVPFALYKGWLVWKKSYFGMYHLCLCHSQCFWHVHVEQVMFEGENDFRSELLTSWEVRAQTLHKILFHIFLS